LSVKVFNKNFLIILFLVCIFVSFFFYRNIIIVFRSGISQIFAVKGNYEYKHSNYEKAANTYNYALRLHPDNSRALFKLADLYAQTGHYQQAEDYYIQALAVNPDYLQARIKYALLLSDKLNNIDMAVREYETAAERQNRSCKIPVLKVFCINKKLAVVYNNLGLLYSKKAVVVGLDSTEGRDFLEKSVKSFQKSLEINPNNYEIRYNTALAYQMKGEPEKAAAEYCKAIKQAPLKPEIHYNLGLVLMELKKYKDAKQELEKANFILQTANNGSTAEYVQQALNEAIEKELIEENNSGNSDSAYSTATSKDGKKSSKNAKAKNFFDFDIKSCGFCNEISGKKS